MKNPTEAREAATTIDLIPTTDLVKTPIISFMPDGCLYVNKERTGKCPVIVVFSSCPAKRGTPNEKLEGRCIAW
jgi:hypothetical protein